MTSLRRRYPTGRAGMTLIEVLVTLALGMILIFFIYGFFRFQHGIAIHQTRANDLANAVRGVLGTIDQAAETAGLDPLGANALDPTFGVIAYGPQTITITADANADGRLEPDETLTLELDPPEVRERRGDRETVLNTRLKEGTFSFLALADHDGEDNDGDGFVDQPGELGPAPEEGDRAVAQSVRVWQVHLQFEGERPAGNEEQGPEPVILDSSFCFINRLYSLDASP